VSAWIACPECEGEGYSQLRNLLSDGLVAIDCVVCGGTGQIVERRQGRTVHDVRLGLLGLLIVAVAAAIIGGLLTLSAVQAASLLAAPRAAAIPTTTVARDLSGPIAGASGSPLPGAPPTATRPTDVASPGSMAAVGSDAPYPVDPRLSSGGAPPDGAIGSVLLAGRANFAASSHGPNYLAIRFDRGTRVRICGAGGCRVMRSTDYGPKRTTGDLADIALVRFAAICGLSIGEARQAGECDVEIELLGRTPLPETDPEEPR
jgi:hypothetical protein